MPTTFLDGSEGQVYDPSHLVEKLLELPQQIERAAAEVAVLTLPEAWASAREVVFCGMGGSAIGGEVAATLPVGLMRKPIVVNREYELPAYVGKDTLVVVVSYSSETEEALACFAEAGRQGAMRFVVGGPGPLTTQAREQGVPCYEFSYQAPPRDAFGYLFTPLVRALAQAGVLEPAEADLTSAVAGLKQYLKQLAPEVPTNQNLAKALAYACLDRVPLVVGSRITLGVARRWKNQINEHAKAAAFWDAFPETNHNTTEGFTHPARFKDDVVVILLAASADHPEVARRRGILKSYLVREHVVVEEVQGEGAGLWAEKLTLLALGDFMSYYLALLNHVDPEPVLVIQKLKAELRRG